MQLRSGTRTQTPLGSSAVKTNFEKLQENEFTEVMLMMHEQIMRLKSLPAELTSSRIATLGRLFQIINTFTDVLMREPEGRAFLHDAADDVAAHFLQLMASGHEMNEAEEASLEQLYVFMNWAQANLK